MNGADERQRGRRRVRPGGSRVFILLTISAWIACAFCACGSRSKVESGPYTALGEVAARSAAALLGGKGTIVLIVNEADERADTALGQAIKSFNEALKTVGSIQVTDTERIKPAAAMVSGVEPVSAARFLEIVNKHASANALVSFAGVPRLTVEQMAQLPAQGPRIIAAVTYNPPSRMLFTRGILHLAIVSQPSPMNSPPQPRTAAEWFEANYRIVTPETAGSLPP